MACLFQGTLCVHSHLQFILAISPTDVGLESVRKPVKPKKTYADTEKTCTQTVQ